jgi:hypothetical protein
MPEGRGLCNSAATKIDKRQERSADVICKCHSSHRTHRALVLTLAIAGHRARPSWLHQQSTTAHSTHTSQLSFCSCRRHAGKSIRPMLHAQIAFSPYSISSQSYRSRQSSLELDGDDRLLLRSTPTIYSKPTRTERDKGFIKAIRNLRQRLLGWRFGVLLSSVLASFVLVTNCVAAIVIQSTCVTRDGVSTAFEGDCDVANRWSLGLHIVINILSSLLLSASNYTMQVLNAPTRSECDEAHVRGDWLDIGITSLRNIARITRLRRVLWLLLGFSSIPIHLFYNSVAFKTISTNAYLVIVATPLFLQSNVLPPSHIKEVDGRPNGTAERESETLRQVYLSQKLDFANLTAAECINTYGVDFVTSHSDVVAVISGRYPINVSVQAVKYSYPMTEFTYTDPYTWYASPTHDN